MFDMNLNTNERLTKIKIQLQEEKPFWAYTILKLVLIEDKNNQLPPWGKVGVNVKGEMLWNKEFIDSLNDNEIKYILAHETGHLLLNHLTRCNGRNPLLFNIASDIVLNNILIQNDFILPEDVLKPKNNSITVFGYTVKDISNKNAEIIYDELQKQGSEEEIKQLVFDHHGYGTEMTAEEKAEMEERWKNNMVEAVNYSKMRGKLPSGMEEIIGNLLYPKFNWKYLIRRYIINALPYDYSFNKPNMKIPEVILPGTVKETVEIVAHIDTSGSISNKELTEFITELVSISNSHSNVKITLIECDAEIQQVIEINSYNKNKLRTIKVKGRGGTSHKPVWEYINKKIPQCKLLISFTDLYSDVTNSDKPRYNVVWVIPKGYEKQKVSFGKHIYL